MCEFNEISGYLLPLAVERFLGCDFKELANPSLDICDNQQSHNRPVFIFIIFLPSETDNFVLKPSHI
jgi:hypothetical protein